MKNIHLIEKTACYNRVPDADGQWTTGTWSMSPETAESLIGGKVFLHTKQEGPSYLGGEILECIPGAGSRYTIRFQFNEDAVNITTKYCKKNWSVEMLLEPVVK